MEEKHIKVILNDNVSHALDSLPDYELNEIRSQVQKLIHAELVKRGRIKILMIEENQKDFVVFDS